MWYRNNLICFSPSILCENILKITKGQSEAVNLKYTDNRMAKRKRTIIYKTLHRQLMIEQDESRKKSRMKSCSVL